MIKVGSMVKTNYQGYIVFNTDYVNPFLQLKNLTVVAHTGPYTFKKLVLKNQYHRNSNGNTNSNK